ncbi:GH12 family glycosyl hydrolase domain-containing protein [Nocardiopsis halophila]|uniref:GH12 family glycosyl hydrolase domain-containing protein n=1 Tax=Nocardiopsis halophila TaxID=141692 RepID=UPI000347F3F3|nr:hypothetical protein [Nocardiopsis halophila]
MEPTPRTPARLGGAAAALLLTAAAFSTGAAHPATATTVCEPFGEIPMGEYWLNNNVWGQDAGSGSQCVEDLYQDGDTIGWRTEWDWEGDPYQVKSYVSSVLGWHWGWNSDEDTGLPVRLSSGRALETAWEYDLRTEGTVAVAYDLWLHDIADPGWSDDPADEVMVWLSARGGAGPLGERIDTVEVGGERWDLYQGAVEDDDGQLLWDVHSFVHTGGTRSFEGDLTGFTDHLADRGALEPDQYLSSVQAGIEVFQGTGVLETTAYRVTRGVTGGRSRHHGVIASARGTGVASPSVSREAWSACTVLERR